MPTKSGSSKIASTISNSAPHSAKRTVMTSARCYVRLAKMCLCLSERLTGPLDRAVLQIAMWARDRAVATPSTVEANEAERRSVGGYEPGEKRGQP